MPLSQFSLFFPVLAGNLQRATLSFLAEILDFRAKPGGNNSEPLAVFRCLPAVSAKNSGLTTAALPAGNRPETTPEEICIAGENATRCKLCQFDKYHFDLISMAIMRAAGHHRKPPQCSPFMPGSWVLATPGLRTCSYTGIE
jgi:hypothetical protein